MVNRHRSDRDGQRGIKDGKKRTRNNAWIRKITNTVAESDRKGKGAQLNNTSQLRIENDERIKAKMKKGIR